jgi:hypothetical protein
MFRSLPINDQDINNRWQKNAFLCNKNIKEGIVFVKLAARKTVTSQTAAWFASGIAQLKRTRA